MKIQRDSIVWYEPGRLKALARNDMSPRPAVRILLAGLAGSLLGLAALSYAKSEQPIIMAAVASLAILAPVLVISVHLYFGRSVALTSDRAVLVSVGSRAPRRILFSELVRCETQTISTQNSHVPVLVLETSDGRKETIELPGASDTEVVSAFLRERNVRVSPAAQPGAAADRQGPRSDQPR
jgi:hypothetical protein